MIDVQAIRAVLLDADETLYSLRESIGTVYSRCAKECGIEIPSTVIDARFAEHWPTFRSEYENVAGGYATSPGREREMWRRFCRLLIADPIDESTSEELFTRVYESFAHPSSRVLAPHVTTVLEKLQERGHITGILSNNDGRVRNIIRGMGVEHLFHHVFPTEELGYKKPSPHCFACVEEKLSLNAQEILYIGDSVEHDYWGARNAGWQALLYNPQGKPFDESVAQIVSFEELQRLIFQPPK